MTREDAPTGTELAAIEELAVELAALAGAEITAALGRELTVRYKGATGAGAPTDPVSEVDHRVEQLVRVRLGERFPEHDIIGEEMDERPGRGHDMVWAIDPVDGTANFINGFPLFAGSIGVLFRGRPVAGAVWCSTSHALRPGVYHARERGPLHFDGDVVARPGPAAGRRHMVGLPDLPPAGSDLPYDVRKTGSAAVECAFVAAGLLRAARFNRPNLWDVAGGAVLVRAAGGDVRWRGPNGWAPLERFEAASEPAGEGDLRTWRNGLAIGEAAAVAALCRA